MINPIWLRSFCTLVEVGHFTRTAEHLFMTQSGVSQHVRKLEEHLSQKLLDRQGKSFTLTDAGDRLYKEGQKLILALADLEERVSRDPVREGVVTLASPGSVGLKLYHHLLTLQRRYPNLVIEYRFAPNADVERLIAEHKVDIGFMTCLSTRSEVSLKSVAQEELLLVTPATISEPSWEHLVQLGFIDHPDGAYHAAQLLGVNFHQFQHIHQFRRSGFSNQINLILEPVSQGLGFTVLPSHAVSAFNAPDKVSVHRLSNAVNETLYVGTHTHKFIPSRVATVITEAVACLKCR